MKAFFIITLFFYSLVSKAQENPKEIQSKIYTESEVNIQPKLMYGSNALTRHVYRHFKAPKKAIPVPPKIQCSFVVEIDGTISNIKVLNTIDEYYKNEAIETLASFKEPWYPAVKDNQQVRCIHYYDINLAP